MITAASSYWGMSGYQPFRRPVLDFEEETIYWEEKLLKSPSESKIKHERRIKQRQNRDLEMSVSNVMQFDPSIDYLNLVEVLKDLDGRKKKVKKYDYSMFDEDFIGNKPVFIHFSEQSREMMADPIKFYKTLKFVGERKLSTKFPMMQFDIEQYYWRMVKFLLCESNATFLFGEYFEDGEMGTMCKDFVDGHIEALDEHEHVLVNAFFSK
ncbi:glycosyltransferase family 71 protein [[Candida] arabinofermentans NRRL YB-2248]|uniref:Glycosyltransferase family 71 protein n=1 Tax=[Candida] arabinofermentans NRRL YB-2248 TaxID=983967 RepID=A0A1E4T2D3_9ASCO|nr:glycosyltransferase family 71 protein [[Candida] arabinofermentans NRRL YB-2248]